MRKTEVPVMEGWSGWEGLKREGVMKGTCEMLEVGKEEENEQKRDEDGRG